MKPEVYNTTCQKWGLKKKWSASRKKEMGAQFWTVPTFCGNPELNSMHFNVNLEHSKIIPINPLYQTTVH